jgi:hypothetical protein
MGVTYFGAAWLDGDESPQVVDGAHVSGRFSDALAVFVADVDAKEISNPAVTPASSGPPVATLDLKVTSWISGSKKVWVATERNVGELDPAFEARHAAQVAALQLDFPANP